MSLIVRPDLEAARRRLAKFGLAMSAASQPKPVQIVGDIAQIELTNGLCALVDIADAELVAAFGWRACKGGQTAYVRTTVIRPDNSRVSIKLHRFLLGVGDASVHVDHVDGDGLNNVRGNLRQASPDENARNRRMPSHNSSGFKGVAYCPMTGRWRAEIYSDRKRYRLGRFDTPELAAAAYDAAALKLHGEFARTNQMLAA